MLPIYSIKDNILDAIRTHDTVVITAETGSGKSTQVPKFLYEIGYSVIITEPRRMAAVSLAHRVQDELNGSGVVGYQTAFDKSVTKDTKILYCTDGLQLVKGIDYQDNTILVIDEVHEWNLNIEALIAWVNYIRTTGRKIKVVLMSATADVKNILEYFTDAIEVHAGGKLYEVEQHEREASEFVSTIVEQVRKEKNVLAFVSGKAGIRDVAERLDVFLDKHEYIFIPLHGELSREEQDRCFASYDKPKIVCATNIAQTSITIPDIDVVVDTGLEKKVEIIDGIEGLYETNISKSDIIQRAGRAGRVKNGQYFLCSDTPISERKEYSEPEILRLNLEKVVLKLASVGIDADKLTFLHMPSSAQLRKAKKLLVAIGAITKENTLTPIGSKLVMIPVSVVYGRMIIEAEKYGKDVLEDIIIIASISESGSLVRFKADHPQYPWRFIQLSDFTQEEDSDLIGELELYRKIQAHTFKNLYESGINTKTYFRAKELHQKMMQSLRSFIEFNDVDASEDRREILIRCIVAGLLHSLYYHGVSAYIDVETGNTYLYASRGTVVRNPKKFAVGKPRTISFKDRYGYEQTMDILTNITSVDFETIRPFIPDDAYTIRYDEQSFLYNPEDKMFHCTENTYFKSMIVNSRPIALAPDVVKKLEPELYEHLMRMYEKERNTTVIFGNSKYRVSVYFDKGYLTLHDAKDVMNIPNDAKLVTLGGIPFTIRYNEVEYDSVQSLKEGVQKEENDKICIINGHTYDVYKNWGNGNLYIYYNNENELLELDPDTHVRTVGGTPLCLRIGYGDRLFKTVREAQNYLIDRNNKRDAEQRRKEMEAMFHELQSSLPKPSGKIELLKEGFKLLGRHDFMGKEIFLGLKSVKKSVKYESFNTQEEADTNTKEALAFLIDLYIKKYPESSFFEKQGGQKILTVNAVRAKGEFFKFVSEISASISIDTIDDAIDMIDEMYEECISGLKR